MKGISYDRYEMDQDIVLMGAHNMLRYFYTGWKNTRCGRLQIFLRCIIECKKSEIQERQEGNSETDFSKAVQLLHTLYSYTPTSVRNQGYADQTLLTEMVIGSERSQNVNSYEIPAIWPISKSGWHLIGFKIFRTRQPIWDRMNKIIWDVSAYSCSMSKICSAV